MTRPQGVRALLWLKSREWLGESRDPSRLILLGALLTGWTGVLVLGSVQAHGAGRVDAGVAMPLVAGAAWPLWALAPLMGGGGGDVVASHRLACFPVRPRSVFLAAWCTALFDVPYLVVAPIVLGLSVALAGWWGALAATLFIVGASGVGQVAAWTNYVVLAGRKRHGATALLLTAAVVGLLALAPVVMPAVGDLADVLPGSWLDQAVFDARIGRTQSFVSMLALLVTPIPIAAAVGPLLARHALGREAASGGSGTRPWGAATWWVRGSMLRVLVAMNVRSMARAAGAQVGFAGVLAVPAVTRFPGIDFAEVSLVAMGSIAGLAAAVVLGVNSFAFDAGGATMLLSLPVRARDVVVAKAIAIGSALLVGQLLVTAVGAAMLRPSAAALLHAAVLCVARTALLTAVAMMWSLRVPASSDYDSLRARISAPGAIVTFGLAAATCGYVVSASARVLPGVTGTAALTGACLAVGIGYVLTSSRLLNTAGVERVASAVTA